MGINNRSSSGDAGDMQSQFKNKKEKIQRSGKKKKRKKVLRGLRTGGLKTERRLKRLVA